MSDSERAERARGRLRTVRLVKSRLGDPEHDFSPVRGEQAMQLATQLTAESWAAAGRELPRYSRAEAPYRFVRGWPP